MVLGIGLGIVIVVGAPSAIIGLELHDKAGTASVLNVEHAINDRSELPLVIDLVQRHRGKAGIQRNLLTCAGCEGVGAVSVHSDSPNIGSCVGQLVTGDGDAGTIVVVTIIGSGQSLVVCMSNNNNLIAVLGSFLHVDVGSGGNLGLFGSDRRSDGTAASLNQMECQLELVIGCSIACSVGAPVVLGRVPLNKVAANNILNVEQAFADRSQSPVIVNCAQLHGRVGCFQTNVLVAVLEAVRTVLVDNNSPDFGISIAGQLGTGNGDIHALLVVAARGSRLGGQSLVVSGSNDNDLITVSRCGLHVNRGFLCSLNQIECQLELVIGCSIACSIGAPVVLGRVPLNKVAANNILNVEQAFADRSQSPVIVNCAQLHGRVGCFQTNVLVAVLEAVRTVLVDNNSPDFGISIAGQLGTGNGDIHALLVVAARGSRLGGQSLVVSGSNDDDLIAVLGSGGHVDAAGIGSIGGIGGIGSFGGGNLSGNLDGVNTDLILQVGNGEGIHRCREGNGNNSTVGNCSCTGNGVNQIGGICILVVVTVDHDLHHAGILDGQAGILVETSGICVIANFGVGSSSVIDNSNAIFLPNLLFSAELSTLGSVIKGNGVSITCCGSTLLQSNKLTAFDELDLVVVLSQEAADNDLIANADSCCIVTLQAVALNLGALHINGNSDIVVLGSVFAVNRGNFADQNSIINHALVINQLGSVVKNNLVVSGVNRSGQNNGDVVTVGTHLYSTIRSLADSTNDSELIADLQLVSIQALDVDALNGIIQHVVQNHSSSQTVSCSVSLIDGLNRTGDILLVGQINGAVDVVLVIKLFAGSQLVVCITDYHFFIGSNHDQLGAVQLDLGRAAGRLILHQDALGNDHIIDLQVLDLLVIFATVGNHAVALDLILLIDIIVDVHSDSDVLELIVVTSVDLGDNTGQSDFAVRYGPAGIQSVSGLDDIDRIAGLGSLADLNNIQQFGSLELAGAVVLLHVALDSDDIVHLQGLCAFALQAVALNSVPVNNDGNSDVLVLIAVGGVDGADTAGHGDGAIGQGFVVAQCVQIVQDLMGIGRNDDGRAGLLNEVDGTAGVELNLVVVVLDDTLNRDGITGVQIGSALTLQAVAQNGFVFAAFDLDGNRNVLILITVGGVDGGDHTVQADSFSHSFADFQRVCLIDDCLHLFDGSDAGQQVFPGCGLSVAVAVSDGSGQDVVGVLGALFVNIDGDSAVIMNIDGNLVSRNINSPLDGIGNTGNTDDAKALEITCSLCAAVLIDSVQVIDNVQSVVFGCCCNVRDLHRCCGSRLSRISCLTTTGKHAEDHGNQHDPGNDLFHSKLLIKMFLF